jgi:hypothetical protein
MLLAVVVNDQRPCRVLPLAATVLVLAAALLLTAALSPGGRGTSTEWL